MLNCLPPFSTDTPSPAMSILKAYLCKFGYTVKVIYWNILLKNLETEFIWNNHIKSKEKQQDTTILYAAYLAVQTKNESLYKEVKAALQRMLPVMLNESKFYDEHIEKYAIKLDQFIDEHLDNINFSNILYFGFSMKMDQWILASVIAEKVKKRETNIPIVIGGIGTAKISKSFLNSFKQFDFSIWGEGEFPLKELTRLLLKDNNFSEFNVERTFYREDDMIKESSAKKHTFLDLSTNEIYPDFSDFFIYKNKFELPDSKTFLSIEGGRGCYWNKCHFCYLNKGYIFRQKSVEKISQEIRYMISMYGIYHFEFLDNDIIGKDMIRFCALLDELIKIKKEYPDFIIIAVEVITIDLSYELIKKMFEAGISNIQIGYESASNNLLKKINKKNTFASNLNTIKHCFELGINVSGVNIIHNLLEETDEDIYESLENLRFFRFILKEKGWFIHIPSTLMINSSSKYYNAIKDKKQEYIPKILLYHKAFINHFNEDAKWDFFEFALNQKDYKWEHFTEIQFHFWKNKYEYNFIHENNRKTYQELFNDEVIEHVEFDNDESYINILSCCYDKAISINELNILLLKNDTIDCEVEKLKEKIDFLFFQGLVYRTPDYNEIVSIVNINKIPLT